MPTSPRVAAKLAASLPNDIKGPIYELGAGWGTLAFALAKKYPFAPIKAFENSPVPYIFCRVRAWIWPVSNLYFYRQNFFEISLHDAEMIICYLYPGAMERLKEKFESELTPGTLIVSNTFAIPGWTPINVIEVNDLYHSKIYFYMAKQDQIR